MELLELLQVFLVQCSSLAVVGQSGNDCLVDSLSFVVLLRSLFLKTLLKGLPNALCAALFQWSLFFSPVQLDDRILLSKWSSYSRWVQPMEMLKTGRGVFGVVLASTLVGEVKMTKCR